MFRSVSMEMRETEDKRGDRINTSGRCKESNKESKVYILSEDKLFSSESMTILPSNVATAIKR